MISDGYKELLSTLAIPTVSLGYFAIRIYDVDELEEAQIGYSVDPSGISLIDENPGSWQTSWVVIGYEDGSGDPIFIDSAADGFPVYSARHGTGAWRPNLIASGLRNFATAMREIARLAEGRENPVQLEANRIEPEERANVLERIRRDNTGSDTAFWESWLTPA
jgi:hypothetical protein